MSYDLEDAAVLCCCRWERVAVFSAFGHVIREDFQHVVDVACVIHGVRS